MSRQFSLKKPCAECPFRRDLTDAGRAGLDEKDGVLALVGQAVGPFLLPCHMDPGYRGQGDANPELAQCAGAATFRANLGVTPLMPTGLHALPPDREAVVGTPAELVAAHRRVSLAEAERILCERPPAALFREELRKAGVKYVRVGG
jgi:hypothetical protein